MELEELQKAWKELNERVSQNEGGVSSATDYRDVVTAKRKLPAKNAEDGQNSFYIYVRSNDSNVR